jgi:hypothetical protein
MLRAVELFENAKDLRTNGSGTAIVHKLVRHYYRKIRTKQPSCIYLEMAEEIRELRKTKMSKP